MRNYKMGGEINFIQCMIKNIIQNELKSLPFKQIEYKFGYSDHWLMLCIQDENHTTLHF